MEKEECFVVWCLKKKNQDADYMALVTSKANNQPLDMRDWEIGQVNSVVHSFKDEIVDYIIEHGLASLISSEPLVEMVVAKGATPNRIVEVFKKYLAKAGVDKELIIVDPYFYHPINAAYEALVVDVIAPHLMNLEDIRVITAPGSKVTPATKANIEAALRALKPTLNIDHSTTDEHHDRYWITNNREKGVASGGSLSTLGRKYCLIDRMNTTDVREYVAIYKAAGLIP